jgi:periplasmic protein TonB
MPRDLFGNVTRPSVSIGNRKWYTLPLSLFSHSAIVLLLIAIPILAPAAMPSVFADDATDWIRIDVPEPPPPPRPATRPDDRPPVDNRDAAPVDAPDKIAPERPDSDPFERDGPIIIGDVETDPRVLAPPPPPAVKTPPPPVRVGGAIRPPVKINSVNPVYSAIAQAARVQGIVIIEATIGEDGHVTNARILRSIPLLDQAAVDAVRQWQFTPTLLNGVPVPVIMTVTVNFTLK